MWIKRTIDVRECLNRIVRGYFWTKHTKKKKPIVNWVARGIESWKYAIESRVRHKQQ